MENPNNKVKVFRTFTLNYDLKRRLLKSIQSSEFNTSHFPEFETVYNIREVDISDLSDEEKKVLLKIARRIE